MTQDFRTDYERSADLEAEAARMDPTALDGPESTENSNEGEHGQGRQATPGKGIADAGICAAPEEAGQGAHD